MKPNWYILSLCIGVLSFFNTKIYSQQALGLFEKSSDVGAVISPGSTSYNASTQTYEVKCAGTNSNEAFHFLWKRMTGDFILYARVDNSNALRTKIGWMVRNGLDTNAAFVRAGINKEEKSLLQIWENKADTVSTVPSGVEHADVIQLERKDSVYTMRVARFGEPFVTTQVTALNIGDEVYVGLFAYTDDKSSTEKKILFQDVRITIPVDDNLILLRTDIGSNLEILNVETGRRQLVYTDSNSIHSPIWKKDSKTLLYGKQGYLYTFDLNKRVHRLLYTGEAKNNNNDHVLSPDGTTLAICIPVQELGGRVVYIVPVTGGIPRLITRSGPSYPHGWSPDGKSLLISWLTKGEYDIYRIPAKGGKGRRLTTAKGRDDCPEYTPDGKYIYFNSNRTGTMLLWRMKPDGSNQEPVTDGKFHDWFPHVSPNGKWIVFLSYSKDEVSSAGNPSYKQVYLRMMPTSGGKPKIIAYLYGGQGTINSPCWSPDSKTVAFASYTDIKQ